MNKIIPNMLFTFFPKISVPIDDLVQDHGIPWVLMAASGHRSRMDPDSLLGLPVPVPIAFAKHDPHPSQKDTSSPTFQYTFVDLVVPSQLSILVTTRPRTDVDSFVLRDVIFVWKTGEDDVVVFGSERGGKWRVWEESVFAS
jgi:hypothetical protein